MDTASEQLYGALRPKLEELEAERLRLKRKGVRNGAISLAKLVIIGLIIDLSLGQGQFGWTLILAVIGLLIWPVLIGRQSEKLRAFYKEQIIQPIVASIYRDADYRPEEGIDEKIFCSCGLFSTHPDSYGAEDMIEGRVGATRFSFSEVHAQEKRTSHNGKGGTTTYWVDIFRGFLFVADFNKEFAGRTVVKRNTLFSFSAPGERVKLEDPAFEKRFDVYSTDQIEARYILSTSLMKRITELDEDFGGRLTLSFHDSSLVVAIPEAVNHFEASVWRSVLDRTLFEREFGTIRQLVGIVDELNLNLRIWSKR